MCDLGREEALLDSRLFWKTVSQGAGYSKEVEKYQV